MCIGLVGRVARRDEEKKTKRKKSGTCHKENNLRTKCLTYVVDRLVIAKEDVSGTKFGTHLKNIFYSHFFSSSFRSSAGRTTDDQSSKGSLCNLLP